MSRLRISGASARRIARLASRGKLAPQKVLDAALAAGLDYEEWFRREVARGLADLDTGKVVPHEQVLRSLARSKAALARALRKAA